MISFDNETLLCFIFIQFCRQMLIAFGPDYGPTCGKQYVGPMTT